MRAQLDGVVVAEADEADVVSIEGNSYFPPSSLVEGALVESATPYTCPWKGVAQYWDVVSSSTAKDGAWSYPHPYDGAAERVGRDFAGYVAFDTTQVTVGA